MASFTELGKAFSNSAGTSTLVVTLGAGGTAGRLVVARVVAGSATIVSSVADSRSNTWAVDIAHGTGPRPCICSTLQNVGALQSGDTVTFTFSGTSAQKVGIIDEFSDPVTASPLDKTATGTATGTARSAGTTATLSQADELIVAAFGLGAAETTFTVGGTFDAFTTQFHNATGTAIEGEWDIVAATTAVNPTATGRSFASNGVTATYKLVVVDVFVPRNSAINHQNPAVV